MNPLAGALCVGQWWLFDSTEINDHMEAAELCAACPVRDACDNLLREVQADTRGTSNAGGGPAGTWAGYLVGVKKKYEGKPREHGTTRGYYQHKNRKEDPCADCRRAMRESLEARLRVSGCRRLGSCEHHDRKVHSRWDNQSGARGTLATSPGTSTRANPVRGSTSRDL